MFEHLKLVALFSSIVCIISCKDNVQIATSDILNIEAESTTLMPKEIIESKRIEVKTRQDSIVFLNKIKRDITELIVTKNNIDSLIFGDCIYYIINKTEPQKIRKKDILNNFNLVFDTNFRKSFKKELLIENFEYVGAYNAQYKPIDNHFKATYVRIAISEQHSEYGFSRIYWFRNKNDKWVFSGLTCVG